MSPPTKSGFIVLGETDFRAQHRPFGLGQDDRLRHLWIIGKTGSGKSTLIAEMARQDLVAGNGLAVIDPHGDLIETLLPYVPRERTNDVLLFAPEDREWPVAFNVFRSGRKPHPDPALLASQLISIFRKFWADSWGPRLEHVLRNAVLAIAPDPRATMLFLYRFLTDEPLREKVVATIADPVVRHFWTKEFPSYPKALQGEALAPALNKLGAFVANPIVRNIVAQERSRVDLRNVIDDRGILFAKLPTGAIGEDASHLMGGLLLTALQLAAMEREDPHPAFTVYIDEFQHFVTDSLATLLSESRKFGLGLVLAHQYVAQLTDAIRDAVLGNVGTAVCFRLGAADATLLEGEFAPEFSADDLQHLAPYHFAVRLLARGASLRPFSARALPPSPPPSAGGLAKRVRGQSRARHATKRTDVERQIAAALSP